MKSDQLVILLLVACALTTAHPAKRMTQIKTCEGPEKKEYDDKGRYDDRIPFDGKGRDDDKRPDYECRPSYDRRPYNDDKRPYDYMHSYDPCHDEMWNNFQLTKAVKELQEEVAYLKANFLRLARENVLEYIRINGLFFGLNSTWLFHEERPLG